MDEFLKAIMNDLGVNTITRDVKTVYEEADERLIKEFTEVLAEGNIDHLVKYIYQHNENIKSWCLGDTAIINVYSHDSGKEFPINCQTIALNEYEQKIMQAYDLMVDILY
mgnify:CR=1 FL=1